MNKIELETVRSVEEMRAQISEVIRITVYPDFAHLSVV
jgi:hypothetical protein